MSAASAAECRESAPPRPIAARRHVGEALPSARDAEAGLPIGEILSVEARQQSRRRIAGAVERSHGAELIGDVLIVLIGNELPLRSEERRVGKECSSQWVRCQ